MKTNNKIFDYNKIPEDRYKQVALGSIERVFQVLGEENGKDFLVFFKDNHYDHLVIRDRLEQEYSLTQENLDRIAPAYANLYRCVNGDLREICEVYGIDQAHLDGTQKDKVNDKVRNWTLNLCRDVAAIPALNLDLAASNPAQTSQNKPTTQKSDKERGV